MDPRRETNIVNRYLEAVTRPRKQVGKRTPSWLRKRIKRNKERLINPTGLKATDRVLLIEEVRQCETELKDFYDTSETDALAEEAVPVLKHWAERKGVSYQSFRAMGVPAPVLKRAGLTP